MKKWFKGVILFSIFVLILIELLNVSHIKAEIITIDLPLPSNWSMISLPVLPEDGRIKILFPEARAVFEFTDKYELLDPNDSLQIGRGYWIYLPEARTHRLTGAPIDGYHIG